MLIDRTFKKIGSAEGPDGVRIWLCNNRHVSYPDPSYEAGTAYRYHAFHPGRSVLWQLGVILALLGGHPKAMSTIGQ